jgi:hypothetical protein
MAEANGADSRSPSAQRVLAPARAKAESRTANFVRPALAILGETGRTDFTVLEVVERSKTAVLGLNGSRDFPGSTPPGRGVPFNQVKRDRK